MTMMEPIGEAHQLTDESGWIEGRNGYIAICTCGFTHGIEVGPEPRDPELEWRVLKVFADHLDSRDDDLSS